MAHRHGGERGGAIGAGLSRLTDQRQTRRIPPLCSLRRSVLASPRLNRGMTAMAKGQMRSNKEARKPKKEKKTKAAGEASKSGSGNKPLGDSKKKG